MFCYLRLIFFLFSHSCFISLNAPPPVKEPANESEGVTSRTKCLSMASSALTGYQLMSQRLTTSLTAEHATYAIYANLCNLCYLCNLWNLWQSMQSRICKSCGFGWRFDNLFQGLVPRSLHMLLLPPGPCSHHLKRNKVWSWFKVKKWKDGCWCTIWGCFICVCLLSEAAENVLAGLSLIALLHSCTASVREML